MSGQQAPVDDLLTPAQVAAIVFVDPKTVSRWARAGKIPSTRTLGGHRRFRSSDVEALMRGDRAPRWGLGAGEELARAVAEAKVAEAVAVALEAEADAAARAVTDHAAAVVAAAATAAAAVARARDARAIAAEAALAQDLVRLDGVEAQPSSILRGVAG